MKRRSFVQKSVISASLAFTLGLVNNAGAEGESSAAVVDCGPGKYHFTPQGKIQYATRDCTGSTYGCFVIGCQGCAPVWVAAGGTGQSANCP